MIGLRKFMEMSKEELNNYFITSGFYENIPKILPRNEIQVLDCREILGISCCSWKYKRERIQKKAFIYGITGIGYCYTPGTNWGVTLIILRHLDMNEYVAAGYIEIDTVSQTVKSIRDGLGKEVDSLSQYTDAFN